jgi:PAS domain S-box-containing protein
VQPQSLLRPETFFPYSPTKKTEKQHEKSNFMIMLKEEVDRQLISEYVPATLLVNNNLDILVFRGQVDPYLTHESGTASLNLAKLIRKELRTDVQTAIYRARKENKSLKDIVQFKLEGQKNIVTIKVKPLKSKDYEEPFFLITFEKENPQRKFSRGKVESLTSPIEKETSEYKHIQDLKEDLESTKQSLQTIIEVQEATNEELRSTMEEAQSSNEELQSTNEELETAKEELQSGNEELQTLNEELKNRNLALSRLNDDLTNLQTNVDLPIVIVDNDLLIRRFTASAQELLRISPSDVGRSITSVNHGLHSVDLEKTIKDVITKLTIVKREVSSVEDRWYDMRIRPYLTEEKKIDGAVLSFNDISERKQTDQALRKSEDAYSSLFANMIDGFAYCQMIFDESGKPVDFVYLQINDAFERITGIKKERVVGKKVTEAIPGIRESNPELFEIYGRVALTCQKEKFEVFFRPLNMWLSISVYCPARGYFAAVFEDITERKKMAQKLSVSLEDSQRRESEISALLKSSKAVLQNKEFANSARAIFDAAKELIGATAGYVALLSDNGRENEVLFLDAGGLPCTVDPLLPMPIRGLRAEAYKSGKVVVENDFPQSDWMKFMPNGHVKLTNVLFAPLTIEQKAVGVIGLSNKPGGFTKRDAEMAMAFGEIASVALANSKMLEMLEENEKELKGHSEHLEGLVEERTKQLKDSERMATIGQTAGMVGHDIRNPLQAITSDVYLVKTELASTPDSEEKKSAIESLQEIEKNIDYINKIVADLQDFARPLSPNGEEVDLKLIIDELLTKNGLPEKIKVSVKVEDEARKVVADSTYINRIMHNLINNSVQAMPKGGNLTIHAYKEAKHVVITVKDTGVGVPEQIKSKLFTPMFTTKAKGQGFGLPVIKRMTEALGGKVSFESQEGKGTTFIVRFPFQKKPNAKWSSSKK